MLKRVLVFFPILLAICPFLVLASEINIPRTGQTTSYYTRDDGQLQAGQLWPSTRFNDNANGTVTDNLTGLVWLKNANCIETVGGIDKSAGYLNWANALSWSYNLTSGYCGLTDGSVKGQWRLPNINEMESLLDISKFNPAIQTGHPFANVQSNDYWSSTSYKAWAYAWKVNIGEGADIYDIKTSNLYVWPVRDGQFQAPVQLPKTGQTTSYVAGDDGALQKGVVWPTPRFIDNNNGTVTDNLTGLIWSKSANCITYRSWSYGLDVSYTYSSGGDGSVARDWRVPNVKELQSLVDRAASSPALSAGHPFTDPGSSYWTSSNSARVTANAWRMDLRSGLIVIDGKSNNTGCYWLVRGGQFGSSNISVLPVAGNFASVHIGSSDKQTVTISNGSSATSRLHINAFTLRGTDVTQFSINTGNGTTGTCGKTPILDAGGTCTVEINFNPTSAGSKNATLRVSGSDITAPNIDIPLIGSGIPFTVTGSVVGGNGSISSVNPVVLNNINSSATFTLSPDATYQPSATAAGTCPTGSWNGNNYTTGTISGDCIVEFSFVKIFYPLSVSVSGSGTVHSTAIPTTIDMNCSSGCSQPFEVSSVVTLTPVPASGLSLTGWGGACSGTGVCQVTMNGAKTVSATFADTTPPDTSITSSPPNPSSSTTYTVAFSATEAGSTFECSLGGGPWRACTSPYTNSIIYTTCTNCRTDIPVQFTVRSKDIASNIDPTPASCSWIIINPLNALIDNVQDGGVVQLKTGDMTSDLIFSRSISCVLRGGYDNGYNTVTGTTTIHGSVTITSGTVTIDGIVIQ